MIIFTDLDNCLLDCKYSASSLRSFIQSLIHKGVVISIISSKTEEEILYHLGELGISAPYGAENGSLVKVGEERIELGTKTNEINEDLKRLSKKMKVKIELLIEMDDKRVHEITGLPGYLIPLARDRKFSSPFQVSKGSQDEFIRELRLLDYTVFWGGKFYQIFRGSSKGKAVRLIRKHKKGYAIGIGDSQNDYPMLDECDYPVILNSNRVSKYRRFKNSGPVIWKKVIKKILGEKNG